MKYSELLSMISSGVRPVVIFKKGILENEVYAEPQMRARIISAEDQNDTTICICFDFSEFDEFNKRFESANYFLIGGGTGTARQAGMYYMQDNIYFMHDGNVEHDMEIESDGRMRVYDRYKTSKSKLTYVQWLENQLLCQ